MNNLFIELNNLFYDIILINSINFTVIFISDKRCSYSNHTTTYISQDTAFGCFCLLSFFQILQ